MTVEVILLDVEQDRALGREGGGVLELKARRLADHHRLSGSTAPTSDASGVPTFPATATGKPAWPIDLAEQLHRGGLAVRARHGQEAVWQQAPGQLELAGDLEPARERLGHHGRLARHAGRLDHGARAAEQVEPVGVAGAPRCPQAPPPRRLAAVAADHLAVAGEHTRDRRAGAGEADHQIGAVWERRACVHGVEASGSRGG